MAANEAIVELIRTKAYLRLAEPIQLASGAMSHDFVDVKRGLARGSDLAAVCRAMVDLAASRGVEFDAVGGLTMGADQFAHGVAVVADKDWFVIRKEPKGRGTNKLVEGADLVPGVRVLLVEDAVTTGGSALKALQAVRAEGAEVVLAVTVVDRGEQATASFAAEGVPYASLVTYRDLHIEPV